MKITTKLTNLMTFMAVLSLCLAGSFAIQLAGQLDPDVSWINYGVGRLLQGDRLYRDIVEINPPFIYVISTPPIWLARTLGFGENGFYLAWVLLIATFSSLISYFVLVRGSAKRFDGYFGMTLAHVALATLMIGESFGQREHVLFMLLAPYVYLCAIRLENQSAPTSMAACIGGCAALGIALKPHYILVPVCLELLLLLKRRVSPYNVVRPEIIAGFATAVFLIVTVALSYPEFISEIVPLAQRAYLPFAKEHSLVIWSLFAELILLVSAYAILAFPVRFASPSGALTIAAFSSSIAMLLQYRGFLYQMLPTLFFLLSATFFWIFSRDRAKLLISFFLGIGAITVLFNINSPWAFPSSHAGSLALLRGKSIAVLSTNISDAFPRVPSLGLVWTLRFPCLWFMPFINSVDRAIEKNQPVEQADVVLANALRRQTVDDLICRKPELILLQSFTSQLLSNPVDHLAILGKDQRFAAFFSDYVKTGEIDKYILFSRKPQR